MNSTRSAGNSAVSRSASTRPPTSGITTSVSSRSTPPGVLAAQARRGVRVGRREDLVAAAVEHQPHELAHARVVLDDDDRLRAALGDRLVVVGRGSAPGRSETGR